MITAEQAGNIAFPPLFKTVKKYNNGVHVEKVDVKAEERSIYVLGYRQAKRDMKDQVISSAIAVIERVLDFKENQRAVIDYIRKEMEDEL